VFTDLNYSQSD